MSDKNEWRSRISRAISARSARHSAAHDPLNSSRLDARPIDLRKSTASCIHELRRSCSSSRSGPVATAIGWYVIGIACIPDIALSTTRLDLERSAGTGLGETSFSAGTGHGETTFFALLPARLLIRSSIDDER